MRIGIFILVIILIIGSKYGNLSAQDVETKSNWFEKHPINIVVGNFFVGMPFSEISSGNFYPIAAIGTEFYYLKKEHSQIYQDVALGYYYTQYSTSAFFVNTNIGYRFTFDFGLFADAALGIGYSHLFHPNAVYQSDGSGGYEQVSDWGTPSAIADFSFSIGYDFKKQLHKPVSIYLLYGNYIQLFYNPDIPALPQNSFQIGTRFFINQKKKSNEIK